MKHLKKKLFLKKTTISNLNASQQRMIKGGAYAPTQEVSCCGNTCWETCIPATCAFVTTSNYFCTEVDCYTEIC